MTKFSRILALILLPLFTLALGWQMGMRITESNLELQYQRLGEIMGTGSGQTVQNDPQQEVDLTLLWSVWRLLKNHYIEPGKLDIQNMVYGAVGGMVEGVGDPYTVFMTPTDTRAFEDSLSGTLEGIGAQLEVREGVIIVVAPVKGSPADEAGLLPNDVIVEVNGTNTEGKRLDEVVRLIRGPKGTTVELTLVRPGRTGNFKLSVKRDAIHIPSVESRVEKTAKGNIGYIALNQFGDSSTDEMLKALAAFPEDLIGIILDLRYNGGGYLDGAIDVVSMFQAEGKVVSVETRTGGTTERFVTGKPFMPDLPVVVIINQGSASASEITAGALQDNKRATILGTQSFGKGTVQEVIDLPGGSSLRVTTSRWLTPSGHDLSKKGVTPDILIERTVEQAQKGEDPQLEKAKEVLIEKKN